ncbi:MAG: endo-alpha-N-acetylgalactosaminidase family protein, partial [Propionibacterium sp.]|nr:endo-alpha-N-acetylgalactosaminidase family protein [Propionibacterium sp.]
MTSGGFVVRAAAGFPQILSYGLDGKSITGNVVLLDSFRLNGISQLASTHVTDAGTDWVLYSSTILDPVWEGLEIRTSIRADYVPAGREDPAFGVARICIDAVLGSKETLVHTIGIPGHAVLSVDSSDGPAHLARTLVDTDPSRDADEFFDMRTAREEEVGEVPAPYAFVWNGELAGGVHSNATPDQAANEDHTNRRLVTTITVSGEATKRAAIASGDWVWAPRHGFDHRVRHYLKPECAVVVTAVNRRQEVGWMDAARALRAWLPRPLGAVRVPERVAQRIPFNFGSEATNPFLKSLDNIKRVALATDGLGQWTLLKGYGSEGHDSANSDYGGHYNSAAGGLKDLNILIQGAKRYNTDVAVHINATELYPAARAYSDVLTQDAHTPAWDWLGQSYETAQEEDLGQGLIIDRLEELRAEAPRLDGVYIDAYYRAGWVAEGLADKLRGMGLELGSEYSWAFEGNSIWSHWANDVGYSTEADNVGINSVMLRYMFNTDRDVWNADRLLGGVHMSDFEGWTGKQSWEDFSRHLWTDNVPTKFLQHFRILDWDPDSHVELEGGIEVDLEDSQRVIRQRGVVLARGGVYLLPWPVQSSDGVTSEKMYFYSDTDGTWTFHLTDPFAGVDTLTLYKLGDGGREWVTDLEVHDGQVTISSPAHLAHVLVLPGAPEPYREIEWGEGALVADPGFCSGSLAAWDTEGAVGVERDFTGDQVARFGEGV